MKIKYKRIIFIIFLTLLSSLPIFFKNNAIVQGHDINFHLKRILGVVDNINILKSTPVYYNYLNHFGYGNGLFYPDIFLYIPAILYKLGFSIINSYKILILLINLFSILSIRLCINNILKNEKTTKIGMILYAISLYRFADIYLRGALGESITFIFIPLVILGLYKIFYEDYKEGYYLTIGLTGLMLSHVITTYLMVYFIIIFGIINYKCLKDKKRLSKLIIEIIFSMLITSFFWMPMLEQILTNKFNVTNYIMIFENCVPLPLLITDFEYITSEAWFPPAIGAIYYFIILFFIKQKEKNKFINSILIIGICSILLASLKILWKIPLLYKTLSIIQFPWRLYGIATICFIIVACCLFNKENNKKLKKITLMYLLLIFLINNVLVFMNPTINNNLKEDSIMFGEYLPIELKDNYKDVINNYENKNIKYKYEKNKLNVEIIKEKEEIELPLIYYKGYTAKSNDKTLKIYKSINGLVNVKIDNNIKNINIWYEGTLIKKLSSVLTILSIIIYIFYEKKQK